MKAKKKPARPAAKRKRPAKPRRRPAAKDAQVKILSELEKAAVREGIIVSMLKSDTQKRLERFLSSHFAASATVVIENAVNEYITRDLDANKGVADTFNGV